MYYRITYPKVQCFDNNGEIAVGYEIHTYAAGTTTPAPSYSNRGLTTANTNPIILNSRGEADVYTGVPLKLIFTIPGGDPTSPIWTVDYVGEMQSNFVTGTATAGTANNNYVVATTPAVSVLSNNFMLTMTPDIDNIDTVVGITFTGTGVNDCTAGGPYVGSSAGSIFHVEIDGVASPNTFAWSKDGGSVTAGVAITGSAQILIEGVAVTFAVTTGHTLTDSWDVEVMTPARVNLDSLGNFVVYKNENGTIVPLDGGDMQAGYAAQLIMNEALNAWLLTNPATPIFDTTTISAVRYRKNLTSTYALLLGDQGYELSCVGSFTVNLCTPPEFANRFVYVKNAGTGIITVDAGVGYLIYGTGFRTYLLGPGDGIQLVTNGVNWHILSVAAGIPVGAILGFGGTSPPPSFFLCNGQVLVRASYPLLFNVVGTVYNTGGEAGTDFRLPNLQERFPLGWSASFGIGTTGGAIDHTHSMDHQHTLGSAGTAIAAGLDFDPQTSGASVATTSTANPPYQAVGFIIKY
jgi:microcystin-dependent protein